MAEPFTISFEFRNERFQQASKGLLAFGNRVQVSWREVGGVLKTELTNYLNVVARALAQRHGNPWPDGTTESSLSRRSGALLESIQASVRVYGSTLKDIHGTIGSDRVYARIQEFGGTIVPKHAQFLTVPLPAALNPDGTPIKQSAREWDRTFVIRSKKGNLLIVRKVGADLVPLYVLRTEVVIPPRMKLKTTLEAGLPYFVDRSMEAMLRKMQEGLGA